MNHDFDYIAALHSDVRRVVEGITDIREDIAELRSDLRHLAIQAKTHEEHDQVRFDSHSARLRKLEGVWLKAVGASLAVVAGFEVWRSFS